MAGIAVKITCPYCGVAGIYYMENNLFPQVVLCDTENVAGCDRYFVVVFKMEPVVTTYEIVGELKIS